MSILTTSILLLAASPVEAADPLQQMLAASTALNYCYKTEATRYAPLEVEVSAIISAVRGRCALEEASLKFALVAAKAGPASDNEYEADKAREANKLVAMTVLDWRLGHRKAAK